MMNLYRDLQAVESTINVGVIGAGVFGTKLIDQIETTPGMQTAAVADIQQEAANASYREAGLSDDAITVVDSTEDADAAINSGKRVVMTDGKSLIETDVDVIVEATGLPGPGAEHAFKAILQGKHVVMVTVEADVVVGPLLSDLAAQSGVTYTLAYGDQPALLVELIDWARAVGLDVVAAGKGTPFIEDYRFGVPDDALKRWGFNEEFIENHNPNPKMYNSFLDGTKAAVEMCSVANATDLEVDVSGLHIPPAELSKVPDKLCPASDGGVLNQSGVVDMVSTLYPDGSTIKDNMDANVFLVTTTSNDSAREYLAQKSESSNWYVSDDGKYQLFYRPYHLPGTETTISIANAVLRNEPTGYAKSRYAEVAGMAKKDLEPGNTIDGAGGYTVSGYVEKSDVAVSENLVPFGLLKDAEIINEVNKGSPISYDDVKLNKDSFVYYLRQIEDSLFR